MFVFLPFQSFVFMDAVFLVYSKPYLNKGCVHLSVCPPGTSKKRNTTNQNVGQTNKGFYINDYLEVLTKIPCKSILKLLKYRILNIDIPTFQDMIIDTLCL